MTMRRKAAIVVCALLSAGLLSCAKPLPVMAVRVMAEQADLRREARTALRGEEGAPELHLRESVSENIESLTADGTANAYKVQYSLFYRLPPREERSIQLEQIVSVSESRYLAGRRARADAADRLRIEALRRMRYLLTQQPQK